MLRIALVLTGLTLAACGSSGFSCENAEAAQVHFWGTQTTCTRGTGANTMVFGRGSFTVATCNANIDKCSADEKAKADTYYKCVGKAQPCTPGNEVAAVDQLLACAVGFNSISLTCYPAFQ